MIFDVMVRQGFNGAGKQVISVSRIKVLKQMKRSLKKN